MQRRATGAAGAAADTCWTRTHMRRVSAPCASHADTLPAAAHRWSSTLAVSSSGEYSCRRPILDGSRVSVAETTILTTRSVAARSPCRPPRRRRCAVMSGGVTSSSDSDEGAACAPQGSAASAVSAVAFRTSGSQSCAPHAEERQLSLRPRAAVTTPQSLAGASLGGRRRRRAWYACRSKRSASSTTKYCRCCSVNPGVLCRCATNLHEQGKRDGECS